MAFQRCSVQVAGSPIIQSPRRGDDMSPSEPAGCEEGGEGGEGNLLEM